MVSPNKELFGTFLEKQNGSTYKLYICQPTLFISGKLYHLKSGAFHVYIQLVKVLGGLGDR
jgi:hypothetical protein